MNITIFSGFSECSNQNCIVYIKIGVAIVQICETVFNEYFLICRYNLFFMLVICVTHLFKPEKLSRTTMYLSLEKKLLRPHRKMLI